MRCLKCGNTVRDLFYKEGDRVICRRCLMYRERDMAITTYHGKGDYKLSYSLTREQNDASEFILNEVKQGNDCILDAVTGAGKTEIIFKAISWCIDNHKKVAIVIPRKDVVIELFTRIQEVFKLAKVIKVHGGCNDELDGDVIVLTTHQLYRYKGYFDLVIIDEVDAFPFYKNAQLEEFLKRSVRGNIVYMSATIPKELSNKGLDSFQIKTRYHGEKLDRPKVKLVWSKRTIIDFIKKHEKDIVIIYFPTIKLQEKFFKKFKIKAYVLNSKIKNREEILNEIRNRKEGVILSTLVLERGVTFTNTHVIVYKANHSLFSYENLVQICGRVGRKSSHPHGEILFLIDHYNLNIFKTTRYIKKRNE